MEPSPWQHHGPTFLPLPHAALKASVPPRFESAWLLAGVAREGGQVARKRLTRGKPAQAKRPCSLPVPQRCAVGARGAGGAARRVPGLARHRISSPNKSCAACSYQNFLISTSYCTFFSPSIFLPFPPVLPHHAMTLVQNEHA